MFRRCSITVSAVPGWSSSSSFRLWTEQYSSDESRYHSPSLPCGLFPNVFSKLVAWQTDPSAFSSISNTKPNSHRRHASLTQAVAVCCNAKFRIRGVKCSSCRRALAYEFVICVSRPEYWVLLKKLQCKQSHRNLTMMTHPKS